MRRSSPTTLPWRVLVFLLFLPVSGSALDHTLRVAVGENKPPYTISTPPGGIEYDIISLIVKQMGYTPEIVMVPNARALDMLAQGQVDAAIGNRGGFVSQPYIRYQNVALSLRSRGLVIESIADLVHYRVAAFQNAHLYLGPAFAEMAAANPGYREVSPQVIANQLLFSGRVDVVVSEINIFTALDAQAAGLVDSRQPVTVHGLFPPTRYSLVFRDDSLRAAFDESLKKVLDEDPYPALAKKYLPEDAKVSFRP